jgi:hypothetical protein
MSTLLFLSLRVLHVLLAATWLGATVFMSFMLMPVIEQSGPAGGQIMVGMHRKGLTAFFGALGGLTVLTGIYLFWRFTGGFDPVVSRSNAGIAYGIGGAAGLLATIIGGSVVGRSANKVVDLMGQLSTLPDAQKGAVIQDVDALRQRMKSFGLVVVILQVIALTTMAVGHYV